MALQYCEDCSKQIDLDFNAEHFEEHKKDLTRLGLKELKKKYNYTYNQLAFCPEDYEEHTREQLLSEWEEVILELKERETS